MSIVGIRKRGDVPPKRWPQMDMPMEMARAKESSHGLTLIVGLLVGMDCEAAKKRTIA